MNKIISEKRSEVIEYFIKIETIVNTIISQHYFGGVRLRFLTELLFDVNCTFALKRNVLKKIAPDFPKFEELNRLNSIRNFFAHCNVKFFLGETPPENIEDGFIFNPNDLTKNLDFDKLYTDFNTIRTEVENELWKLLEKLGHEPIEIKTDQTWPNGTL